MIIVMFHDVYKEINIKFEDRYYINGLLSIDSFEKKIKYLKNNYTIISLKDYENKNYDVNDFKKLCILTFDDGLKDHYVNVLPILKKYNITGVFFISAFPILENKVCDVHKIQFLFNNENYKHIILKEIVCNLKLSQEEKLNLWNEKSISKYKNNNWSSSEIFITNILRQTDNKEILANLFDKYVLEPLNQSEKEFSENFYLNSNEIIELFNNNMEIGIHGYYHNTEDNIDSITKTIDFLNSINVITSNYYSYPNGIIDTNIMKTLNIKYAFTTQNINCTMQDNPLLLPRINCSNIMDFEKKIVLCGIQEQGIDICEFLIKNNIKISCIVTLTKEDSIKNKAAGWVDYSEFCEKYNIKIYYCKKYKLSSEEDIEFFKNEKFDLLLLGGWQRLIPSTILNNIKHGGLGQHGSSELLPKGRGRSPLNWSIILSRKRLIWNIFFMTPGIDDGYIIDNRNVNINSFDTCKTLYYKVSIIVKNMYLENIPKILNNQIIGTRQKGIPTFYEKRTPDDGLIDWNKPLEDIYNLIRAVTHPYPGAFTFNGLNKIHIWKAQPFDNNITYPNAKYGEIVEIFENEFVVNCMDGLLLVTDHNAKNIYLKDILDNI
jgi:methionyl-tRNA formyltransferase